jgi:hypothetical protein
MPTASPTSGLKTRSPGTCAQAGATSNGQPVGLDPSEFMATLRFERDGKTLLPLLTPIGDTPWIYAAPTRKHALLFEIPWDWTRQGEVSITAKLPRAHQGRIASWQLWL